MTAQRTRPDHVQLPLTCQTQDSSSLTSNSGAHTSRAFLMSLTSGPADIPGNTALVADISRSAALLADGKYAAADQILEHTQDPGGMRITLRVLARLGRNLPLMLRQQLGGNSDAAEQIPGIDVAERAHQIAETLIEVAEGQPDAPDLHVRLCWELISDGLSDLAAAHLPHAIVTQGLRGDAAAVRALASHLPGFGSGGSADLEYAIGIGMAGDHRGAREVLAGTTLPVQGQRLIRLRAQLHLARIDLDTGTMQRVILELTRNGLGPLLARELRSVTSGLPAAVQQKVMAPALRIFLNSGEHRNIHITLLGEREGLTQHGAAVDFGLRHSQAVQLLTLLAIRQRQDRPLLSTAECRGEIMTGPEHSGLSERQRSIVLADVVRRLRSKLGNDIIVTSAQGNQTYTLNPAYTVTMDLDTVARLVGTQQWRAAGGLLARGVMQGQNEMGGAFRNIRSQSYNDFFNALERHIQTERPNAAQLTQVLNLFLPWQWPDEEIENRAEQLRAIL